MAGNGPDREVSEEDFREFVKHLKFAWGLHTMDGMELSGRRLVAFLVDTTRARLLKQFSESVKTLIISLADFLTEIPLEHGRIHALPESGKRAYADAGLAPDPLRDFTSMAWDASDRFIGETERLFQEAEIWPKLDEVAAELHRRIHKYFEAVDLALEKAVSERHDMLSTENLGDEERNKAETRAIAALDQIRTYTDDVIEFLQDTVDTIRDMHRETVDNIRTGVSVFSHD